MSKHVGIAARVKHVRRLSVIIQTFARHGMLGFIQKSGFEKYIPSVLSDFFRDKSQTEDEALSDSSVLGKRLVRSFEELGPVFVKLGQILATREETLPAGVVAELRRLQDHVKPAPFDVIKKTIASELESSSLSIEVSESPLAAGSIGQVHKATIEGHEVVVKVRRPDIGQIVEQDIALLKYFAQKTRDFFKTHLSLDVVDLVFQLASGLESELNFMKEASNTERIRHNLENIKEVSVPRVYWEYTTEKLLTLEFVSGEPAESFLKTASSELQKRFCQSVSKAFFHMILVDGDFHGDLHPGNLIVKEDASIVILDFGLSYRLIDYQRFSLVRMFSALVDGDYVTLAKRITEVSSPGPEFRLERFQLATLNELSPYGDAHLGPVASREILSKIIGLCHQHEIMLPTHIVMIFKTLIGFESLFFKANCNFDLVSYAKELTEELTRDLDLIYDVKNQLSDMMKDSVHLAKFAPYKVARVLDALEQGRLNIQTDVHGFDTFSIQISRSAQMLSAAILSSAILIVSTLIFILGKNLTGFAVAGFILFLCLTLYVAFKIFLLGRSKP